MTIQQHASFDSSAAELNATSKLVKAWESKNAKNAAKAGGISLMALSLAACGGSSDTVDITSDNAAAIVTALTTEAGVTYATVDAAVAAGIASVDITSDNAALIAAAVAAVDTTTDDASAVSLALRNAAADAGVTGTSTMTNAELITAIKTANDAAIAAGVDLTTDNATAIDAAVVALGISGISTLAQLNSAYDALANPAGSSFALTTSIADYVTGTSGDDSINGAQDGAATETFSSTDTIDGGAGTDTLTIVHSEVGTVLNTPLVRNVENVVYRDVTGGGDLDMANFADTTSLTLERMVGATDVDNLALTDTVNIVDATATYDATLTYTAAGVTGAADSATVNLNGVTAGADIALVGAIETVTVATSGTASALADLVLDAGTTALNISAGADLTVATTLTIASVETLTVSGAGDVTLSADLDVDTATVNASGATGDVSIQSGDVDAAAAVAGVDVADFTATMGSGDDTVDLTSFDADDEFSVSLGAGDDTLTLEDGADGVVDNANGAGTLVADTATGGDGTDTISTATATGALQTTAATGLSGFEVLSFYDQLANSVTVANYQSGLSVTLTDGASAGTLVMEAGSQTVNISGVNDGQLTVTDTGTATSDVLALNNTATAQTDVFNGQAIVVNGYETVNVSTTSGTGTAVAQDFGAITLTVDTGGTGTVNVSGANVANMDGIVTAHTLNFSGLTAQAAGTATADMTGVAFEYAGAAATSGTITGSAGDDVLLGDTAESTNITGGAGDDTITGGSAAETISGGAGDDTINGANGADTVTGGAGDDQITLGTSATQTADGGADDDTVIAAGNLAFGQTITGGDGTDILSANFGTSAAAGSVVSGFETLTLATAGTTDLDNFGNNTFTTVNLTAGGAAQAVQSVRTETITVTAALGADATVTMEDATGTADTATIAISSAAAVNTTNDILVAGVETINLVMDDTNTTAHQNTIALGADSATTINISGDAGVIFATGGNTDIADVITMNASGVVLGAVTDSGVTYVATYNTVGGTTTVTGSNGVDSLTGGAATNDTISGGSGVDTIVYTGGSDTFTGGAGNDVFDINADGTTTAFATIADATASDTVDFVGVIVGAAGHASQDIAATAWDALEVTLGASATFANYLDAAATVDGSTNSAYEWFEFGGNSYIVVSNDATGNFTSGTDTLIAFTGTSLLDDAVLADSVLTIA